MKQGIIRGFSTAEKTELWDRWQRGEPLKAIGRVFGNGTKYPSRGWKRKICRTPAVPICREYFYGVFGKISVMHA